MTRTLHAVFYDLYLRQAECRESWKSGRCAESRFLHRSERDWSPHIDVAPRVFQLADVGCGYRAMTSRPLAGCLDRRMSHPILSLIGGCGQRLTRGEANTLNDLRHPDHVSPCMSRRSNAALPVGVESMFCSNRSDRGGAQEPGTPSGLSQRDGECRGALRRVLAWDT